MPTTEVILIGLSYLIVYLREWNGVRICTPQNCVRLRNVLKGDNHLNQERILPFHEGAEEAKTFVSDVALCYYEVDGRKEHMIIESLTP